MDVMMGGHGQPRWSADDLMGALADANGNADEDPPQTEVAAAPAAAEQPASAAAAGTAAESAALASLNNTGRALDLPQEDVNEALEAFIGDAEAAESYLKRVSGEWKAAGIHGVHTAKRRAPPSLAKDPAPRPTQRARTDASSSTEAKTLPPLVIWDLDETLILFNSLITGIPPFPAAASAAASAAADASGNPSRAGDEQLKSRGAALGSRMESLIWALLDHVFGFERLEKSEYESVTEALQAAAADAPQGSGGGGQSWLVGEGEGGTPLRRRSMGGAGATPAKLALEYADGFKTIISGYNQGREWLAAQPIPEKPGADATVSAVSDAPETVRAWPFRDKLPALVSEISALTDGWDVSARAALTQVAAAGGTNVLVTASHLAAAFAKLMLYELDRFFPAENAVFSAASVSKTDVFTRVIAEHLAEHGGDAGKAMAMVYSVGSSELPEGFRVLVVGDGAEEEAAAQACCTENDGFHTKT